MPNPNTLDWLHYQDIQIPDVTLRTQFRQYMQTGQYAEALALLNNNDAQLQGKAYIAKTINTITNGILELERYYNTGVTLYLSNLTTQYFTMVDNLKKAGTWLSTNQYVPYNFVVYLNDIYMCFEEPPIGTLPTDTQYWLYLGLRGEQGAPGVDVTMKYNWNNTSTYVPNDLVVYEGDIYVALTNNINKIPKSSQTDWLLFLKIGKGQIYVGITPPTNPNNNTIWFKTQTDPSQSTTTNPILGQFMRYIGAEAIWDEMYPNVLFTWIVDEGDYAPSMFIDNVIISQTEWNNNQWAYVYDKLTEQSIVHILPSNGLTSAQISMYNNLSISIAGTTITLTCGVAQTSDLPIIVQII